VPFHAAEQRNKERLNDFPKRQLFASSTGQPKASSEAASGWLLFLVRF
jgi:hypothetical protein